MPPVCLTASVWADAKLGRLRVAVLAGRVKPIIQDVSPSNRNETCLSG